MVPVKDTDGYRSNPDTGHQVGLDSRADVIIPDRFRALEELVSDDMQPGGPAIHNKVLR